MISPATSSTNGVFALSSSSACGPCYWLERTMYSCRCWRNWWQCSRYSIYPSRARQAIAPTRRGSVSTPAGRGKPSPLLFFPLLLIHQLHGLLVNPLGGRVLLIYLQSTFGATHRLAIR